MRDAANSVLPQETSIRPSRWKDVLGPLARIVVAVALVYGAVAVAEVVVKSLRGVLSLGGAVPAAYYLAYLIVSVLVAYFVYRAYVRLVEKRAVSELSRTGASRELGVGMLVGLGLAAATIGVLWMLGYYTLASANAFTVVFVLLANDGAGAFVEEILLRGIVFRITEERLGTWLALVISVVVFALLHLASPHATVISTIVVGIEGGFLLSAAYVLTRRLWLPIGIHFAWDFSQDAIFGVGSGTQGLVRSELSGPALVSGGSAGIEGSIVALLFSLGVGAYLLVRANQRGNIISRAWNREGQRTLQ
jgi:membrane protease YdiL (CAAX protease family)